MVARAVTVGEFGTWTPIGAVQVAGGGYDVAWQNTAPASTRCGAPTATAITSRMSSAPCREPAPRWNRWRQPSTRTSTATGTIGIPKVVIQTDGSTALTEVGNNFYLDTPVADRPRTEI